MSIPTNIPYPPNVPNLAGVPPLAGYLGQGPPAPMSGDAPSVNVQAAQTPQWGIFSHTDGSQALIPDSIQSVGPAKEWRLIDYPTEDGAFQTYNKVEMPFDCHVEMYQGGTEDDRSAFLVAVQRIAGDLNLYDIVTPEVVYPSASIERYDYDRGSSSLLTVRIMLREIRVSATAAFSNTVAPISTTSADAGTVQAQAPTSAQTAAAAGGAQ